MSRFDSSERLAAGPGAVHGHCGAAAYSVLECCPNGSMPIA